MKKLIALSAALFLVACSNDSSDGDNGTTEPVTSSRTFEVSVTNLTAAQPLSPIGVFLHDVSFRSFAVGSPASSALETMAEAGDVSELIDDIDSMAEIAGDAPVGPGGNQTFTLTTEAVDFSNLAFTVLTMLVNTNDAFTGVNAAGISTLEAGQSMTFNAVAYDSGTESNSEAAGTIPGPADGGEGFNAVRDDVNDQVAMHPGVVSVDDGLASSILSQVHRFDNPVARVRITRTQ